MNLLAKILQNGEDHSLEMSLELALIVREIGRWSAAQQSALDDFAVSLMEKLVK